MRGFIGFRTSENWKTEDNLYGIYNEHDSYYGEWGLSILKLYKENSKEYFSKVFNQINWIENYEDFFAKYKHKDEYSFIELLNNIPLANIRGVYDDKLVVFNSKKFLSSDFCLYSYVFNLETDSLEVYRGLFKEKQYECQDTTDEYNVHNYYTHKVLEVRRDSDFKKIEELFENEIIIRAYYEKDKHIKNYEEAFLEDSLNIDEIVSFVNV